MFFPPRLKKVRAVKPHRLHLSYADGVSGEIDFSRYLSGEVFKPLKDWNYFKRVRRYVLFDTIHWPNGADIAPETLYKLTKKAAAR